MESYKLVLPEHLNHYGYLFGGNLLKWVDEVGWIAASLDYPGCNFVTVGLDRVEFRRSVKEGSLLRFLVEREQAGTSAATYRVTVFNHALQLGAEEPVFSTRITFVCLDDCGGKQPLPPPATP
ncbi:MAG: acyl-CoA thioesterase [Thermodesulfobacteriota bacterium]